MKFNKSKLASVIMSGVLAVNVVTPAFAINNENTTTKSSTSTISSQTTTDSDSTNKVWVVDQKEEDVQVVVGYRHYYICNNCQTKFYFDEYPASDNDLTPGENAAAHAAADHLRYSSCAGASVGYSGGKDPIYKTEHHEEIGHYEEITVDQSKLTVKYNKYNEFGDYSEESVDYTSTSDTNAKFVMRHNGTAYPSVTVTPDGDITWKSSDKSVATAASSGEIRAYNLGTTTITATSPNGAYVTFDVEIVPNFTWNGTSCVADYAYAGNGSSSWDYYNQDCDVTSKVTKPATCSHTGETVYTASITVGGKTYTDTKTVETPKTETHSWNKGEITTQPTCTKNGVKTYTCTECRATKTESVPATGHTYGEPKFKWSNDKTSCTASVSCKAGDDTQTANCKVSSKVTTEATCAKEGVRTYTATVTLNGKDYTDTKTEKIAKTENHSWNEGKITTPPTDTREGVKTYTCTVCGKTKTEAIPKLNAEYKKPTFAWSEDYSSCVATAVCTTGGADLKKDCAVTHKTTKNPTCTKTGVETYTATVEVNGKTYTDVKTKDIPATGHTYGEPKFKWSNDKTSCTASVSCKAGDDTQTANCKVSSKVTTEATCAKEGVRTYTATVTLNGKDYTDTKTEKIAKTENHSWNEGKITTPPTDTREGVKTYTCTVCGKTKTEAIPKLNAEYKKPTFAWSEDYSSCVATAVCTTGGADLKKDCAVTHKTTKNPTCTKTGVETYTATVEVNGKTYTDVKTKDIPATGHTYGEPKFKWSNDKTSCTASVSCKAGDDTQTANCKVSSKVTTEATCAKEGVRTYTATVTLNGKDYTDTKTEKIAKTENHSWDEGKVTTPPTDTREGVKTYTCTVCGKTKTEAIPKLSAEYKEPTFAWSSDYTSCIATFVCTTGGSDLKQDCAVTHKTTEATCETAGTTKHTATITFNGKTYTDVKETAIPATGHTYGEPEFNWNGTQSCVATFTCAKCGKTNDVNAKIEKSGSGMKVTYTATVTANGKTYTDQKADKRFVDVADDAYYYDAVDYALKHKITDGTSETTFSPDDNCTRAQIVQFLYNLDARNTETLIAETIPFHDIEDDAWYADAVKWAYENKVTAGTSETTFSPDESCTRAQVVQFLWNRAGNPEPKNVKTAFTDVPEDAWYAKAVAWAAENGITSGTSETTFSPDDNCTRAQIVTLIYHNETM